MPKLKEESDDFKGTEKTSNLNQTLNDTHWLSAVLCIKALGVELNIVPTVKISIGITKSRVY